MDKSVMPSVIWSKKCTYAYWGVRPTGIRQQQVAPLQHYWYAEVFWRLMVTLHSSSVAIRLPLPTFQFPRKGSDSWQRTGEAKRQFSEGIYHDVRHFSKSSQLSASPPDPLSAHCHSLWAQTGFSSFLDHQWRHTPNGPKQRVLRRLGH